jgi:hypothetical protein
MRVRVLFLTLSYLTSKAISSIIFQRVLVPSCLRMSLVKFDSQLHNEYKYGNIKLSKDRENNLNMMHTDPNTSYLA